MKSNFRLIIGTATLCLSVLLSGCGQPGPLYLPKSPAAKPAAKKDGAPTSTALPVPPAPAPQQ